MTLQGRVCVFLGELIMEGHWTSSNQIKYVPSFFSTLSPSLLFRQKQHKLWIVVKHRLDRDSWPMPWKQAKDRDRRMTHASINQHYVKLKCHEEIVQTIVKTIHRDTITEFIEVCRKSNIRPGGHIPIKNVCQSLLYWLVTGKSYRQLHEKSGYPKSNYTRWHGCRGCWVSGTGGISHMSHTQEKTKRSSLDSWGGRCISWFVLNPLYDWTWIRKFS